MNKNIHILAAEYFFETAEGFDRKRDAETDYERKTALMIAAAQNYFYCIINFIEAVFAEKLEEHSFSHENRMNKILENKSIFPEKLIEQYSIIDRNLRNKVAYRGENGKKYEAIKELARLLKNERQI